jgi:glucose/arabinose dehydrogenase
MNVKTRPAGEADKLWRWSRVALMAVACVGALAGSPDQAMAAEPVVQLKLMAEGLAAPIALSSLTDGSGRFLVAEQRGVIRLLEKDGTIASTPFLDIRSQMIHLGEGMEERGITGLALHPRFKENHKYYVVFNVPRREGAPAEWDNEIRLAEFKAADGDPATTDLSTERVVLDIDKPDWNHNSGQIAFGPDGNLYMTVGDGGAPNDVGVRGHAPEGNGQHLTTLLGKVLRLDVDHGKPYAIPSDNPFADGKQGRPEIYAFGVRNPWGISFDRGGNHDFMLADVGQERWEEINIIRKGGNYGWRVKEGFEAFDPNHPYKTPANAPTVGPDGKPFIDPVFVYRTFRGNTNGPQSFGISICGGYVYRGKAIPQLSGKYVFGDWSRNFALGDGTLLVATRPETPDGKWTAQPLEVKDHPGGLMKAFVWSFGQDEQGELYVFTNSANRAGGTGGKVYKLLPL